MKLVAGGLGGLGKVSWLKRLKGWYRSVRVAWYGVWWGSLGISRVSSILLRLDGGFERRRSDPERDEKRRS